jgi:hypothetical protein
MLAPRLSFTMLHASFFVKATTIPISLRLALRPLQLLSIRDHNSNGIKHFRCQATQDPPKFVANSQCLMTFIQRLVHQSKFKNEVPRTLYMAKSSSRAKSFVCLSTTPKSFFSTLHTRDPHTQYRSISSTIIAILFLYNPTPLLFLPLVVV